MIPSGGRRSLIATQRKPLSTTFRPSCLPPSGRVAFHSGPLVPTALKPSEATLLLSDRPFDPLRSRFVCSELQREGAFVLLQLATKTND